MAKPNVNYFLVEEIGKQCKNNRPEFNAVAEQWTVKYAK